MWLVRHIGLLVDRKPSQPHAFMYTSHTDRMFQLLSTLLGGFLALLGGMATTLYLQFRAPATERRARSRQAADELLSILIELRRMGFDPAISAESGLARREPASREWEDLRTSLLLRMESQTLLISSPEVRKRLTFIADALHSSDALKAFEGVAEKWSRTELCTDGMNCLGAYLRDERNLPPESYMAGRARSAMNTAAEIIEEEERARKTRQDEEEK